MDQDASIFVVKSRKGYETRRKLLHAASACVSEHGIAGLTAAAVCEPIGLKRSSFYTHFEGVAGLLDALSSAILEEIGWLSEVANRHSSSSVSILERRITFVLDYCGENPNVGSVLWDLFRQHPPTAKEVRERVIGDISQSLAQKQIKLAASKQDAFSHLVVASVFDCLSDLSNPDRYSERSKQTVWMLMSIVRRS